MYVYNFYSNYKILIIIEFNNLNQTKKNLLQWLLNLIMKKNQIKFQKKLEKKLK